MFQTSTIKFLKDLKKNNNKPWIDKNRDSYLNAKKDFENLTQGLIKQTSLFDPEIKELPVKDCTFRLNRDIRFSKDKTPYKINMGASLNRGGKKSIFAGYYFHLQPGGKSFAGGGLWMPMAPDLKKVRQEIDYCFDELKSILGNKKFISQYGFLESTDDIKLSNLPRGYSKDNPATEYLKLKSFLALKPISDKELTDDSLIKKTTDTFAALMPLIRFINRSME